jgi:hypothetical protein
MFNQRSIHKIYFVGVVIMLLSSLMAVRVLAHDAHVTTETEYPTFIASADGITLPESLVSGITTLTFQNELEPTFQPTLARFINDATLEDFMAAMMAQDFAGMLAAIQAFYTPDDGVIASFRALRHADSRCDTSCANGTHTRLHPTTWRTLGEAIAP